MSERHYANNPYWQHYYAELCQWITSCGLEQGRVLEIGCGLGFTQHLVTDYVGIDIATYPQKHMDKPFCISNAMHLPFPDNTFDGVWSIWVLEHIEKPENMLQEIRRVVKSGGHIFICAAFAVAPWVSQGLHRRPFRDLSWSQRLIKLTIPVRSSIPYKIASTLPRRFYDLLHYLWQRQPTSLRYQTLQPNYDIYWDYDADAWVSLDSYSLACYFLSRGDKPYYARGMLQHLLLRSQPQAYTIHK
jgi:SAM-dependent methyltransferase